MIEWMTTTTILERLKDYGNEDAWSRLSARFRRPIVGFARRMGLSPADADDVAQDTLLTFAERFRSGAFDPARGRLSHWLFGIAYRQALRARRRAAIEPVPLGDDGSAESFWANLPDNSPDSVAWDEEWERAVLEDCLQKIRQESEPVTVRAFELVVLDGKSSEAAAMELGVPIKTVYNAKHRMLKRIRELRAELEEISSPRR